MTVTEFLQSQVPLLSGLLSQEEARTLAAAAQQQHYGAGQTVLFRGTTVDGLYVIATGSVGVWLRGDKASQTVEVAQLGAGEVFGETSILEVGTAGATVRATGDGALIFVIPQDVFRDVILRHPELRSRAEALSAARKKKNADAPGVFVAA